MHADSPPLSRSIHPTLLLTRPAQQSARFGAEFTARFGLGWNIVVSPLTELVFLPAEIDLAGISTVVFTSETAVAAFVRLSPDRTLPCWCVGSRTAEAARRAGFADVRHGSGNAADLAQAMIASRAQGVCLHPRGVHTAGDLKAALEAAGIETLETALYDQPPRPFSSEARALLAAPAPVLVPLFSPRAAVLAIEQMQARRCPVWLAALSPAVAEAAAPIEAERQITAVRPDTGAMLAALQQLTSADGAA